MCQHAMAVLMDGQSLVSKYRAGSHHHALQRLSQAQRESRVADCGTWRCSCSRADVHADCAYAQILLTSLCRSALTSCLTDFQPDCHAYVNMQLQGFLTCSLIHDNSASGPNATSIWWAPTAAHLADHDLHVHERALSPHDLGLSGCGVCLRLQRMTRSCPPSRSCWRRRRRICSSMRCCQLAMAVSWAWAASCHAAPNGQALVSPHLLLTCLLTSGVLRWWAGPGNASQLPHPIA